MAPKSQALASLAGCILGLKDNMRVVVKSPVLAAALVAADVLPMASLASKTEVQFVCHSCAPWQAADPNRAADMAAMFWSFSRVIRALERSGHTLVSICPEQLVVVDGRVLCPIGDCETAPIINKTVCLYAPPVGGPLLHSPELARVRALPAHVDYRGVYYSLAKLLTSDFSATPKLQHALKRCLDDDPEERSLAVV